MSRRPPLDPGGMLVFATLARAGGVRGAAAELGVPRSTVSRRLAELEEQVGLPLVVRTARRFALTELGVVLAARCNELEELLHRTGALLHGASREPSGVLRIEAAPVIGEEILPEVVAELVRTYPKVTVEIRLSADYVDLRGGRVDIALRAWPIEDASDLFAVRLGMSITGFWVSPAYARAHGTPASPEDLASHDCIVVGNATDASWTFLVAGRARRVKVPCRVRVDSFRVARDLAVRGAGIVRTARLLADPLVATGELVPVLERYWQKTPVYAVHAGPNPPSPKVAAFLELARRAARKVLPAT